MQKWIVTGVSGSGRIEFLEELRDCAKQKHGKQVVVHDIGQLMRDECTRLGIPLTDERILDADNTLLQSLRSGALKEVRIKILENPEVDLHLVGVHATFRWKHRIISGISYSDLLALQPDGFLNVVRNIKEIVDDNSRNPKWAADTAPDLAVTQEWMIEEEFVTEVLSDVMARPVYIVSRDHNVDNFTSLFFSETKKIYLSYPITAVREENPELLEKIQGPVLKRLEELFIVFGRNRSPAPFRSCLIP